MALCSNCGKEMGEGIYCGGCGQRTGGGSSPQYQQPQYQAPQPQWNQPQYYPPQASAKTNGMAITAFVMCFVCGFVLPVVFGHIALGQIKRTGEGGRGLAIAALVIGYIQLGVFLLIMIGIASSSNSGY